MTLIDRFEKNYEPVTESGCCEVNPMNKLTKEQVLAIRKDQRSNTEIAKDYNVHRCTIGDIKLRKLWRHI